jgi:hypothetical protein
MSVDQRQVDEFVADMRRFIIRVYLWSVSPFAALIIGMFVWESFGLGAHGTAIGCALITGLFVGLSPVIAIIRFTNDPRRNSRGQGRA